jgi:hypothetical protein
VCGRFYSTRRGRMMTITVRRGRAIIAGCVVGVALLTACGGGGTGAGGVAAERPAVDVAREAPDITRAAGSSRYAAEMTYATTGGPLGDSSYTMSGTGTYDYARQIGDGQVTTHSADLPVPPQETVTARTCCTSATSGRTGGRRPTSPPW